MQPQSLVVQGLDGPLPRDRIHAACGQLLALRLRFRGNCRALHSTLEVLTAEDFVASFERTPAFVPDLFLDMLCGYRFAGAFGSCFGTSRALGQCIDAISIAWRESENLMADAMGDFADPVYSAWPTARACLWGYLTAIGRGDFYLASLLDWHNGLSDVASEPALEAGLDSVSALNAYLMRLEIWAGLRD
jgi:hypothetical protein